MSESSSPLELRGSTRRVQLSDVEPNTWNSNEMSEEESQALDESLAKYGQTVPLVVRKRGEGWQVLDGAHRLEAMRRVQMEEVLVHDLGEMDDAAAKHLSLALMLPHGTPKWQATRDVLESLHAEYEWTEEEVASALPGVVDRYDLRFTSNPDDTDWVEEEYDPVAPRRKKTYEFRLKGKHAELASRAIARAKREFKVEPMSMAFLGICCEYMGEPSPFDEKGKLKDDDE